MKIRCSVMMLVSALILGMTVASTVEAKKKVNGTQTSKGTKTVTIKIDAEDTKTVSVKKVLKKGDKLKSFSKRKNDIHISRASKNKIYVDTSESMKKKGNIKN